MAVVVFDFDGTLLRGDSTKLIFKLLTSNKVWFIYYYYLIHFFGIMVYLYSGNDLRLMESRRKYLMRNSYKITPELSAKLKRYLFQNVVTRMEYYLDKGYKCVIISAGFKEIINIILRNKQIDVFASSIYEELKVRLNFERKVDLINKFSLAEDESLIAFGNSAGDMPMLRIAKKAFWVDEHGEISEFEGDV